MGRNTKACLFTAGNKIIKAAKNTAFTFLPVCKEAIWWHTVWHVTGWQLLMTHCLWNSTVWGIPHQNSKLPTFRTFIYCALKKPNCRLKVCLFIPEWLNHTLEVFTGPKIPTWTRRDPLICCTEPTRTRILFESGTRTRADPRNALNVLPGPDHYTKVGPEPGWEDTDPTAPVPIGTYCTANCY